MASVSPARSKEPVQGEEVIRRRMRVSTSDSAMLERDSQGVRDLSEVNRSVLSLTAPLQSSVCTHLPLPLPADRRLSMEVDQLLNELPPASSLPPSFSGPMGNSLGKLREEQSQLQAQFSQLTDQRTKLSHELQGLLTQVSLRMTGKYMQLPSDLVKCQHRILPPS